MLESQDLINALNRLKEKRASEEDFTRLGEALASGQITLADGSHSVAIGGDATGAQIITGDQYFQLPPDSYELLLKILKSKEFQPLGVPLKERLLGFWQGTFVPLVREHWLLALVALILETALFILYRQYRNLYLILWWAWVLAALSLIIFMWNEYARWKNRSINAAAYLVSLVFFVGLVGWQAWKIANHPTFGKNELGIAFAELGEGFDFRRTAYSRLITDQVYISLCQSLSNTYSGTLDRNLCAEPDQPPQPGDLRVMRIGVVQDPDTARDFGKRINADLVIWGQVLSQATDGGITIRFQILETLDKSINPDFPFTLPATTNSTDIIADMGEVDNRDLEKVKQVISAQTTVMSSFILGMAAYMEQDFPLAIQQLERSVNAIEGQRSLEISPHGLSLMYYYLGRANQFLGNVAAGQDWLLKASEKNPDEPAIPLSLAFGYRSLGAFEERDASLDKTIELIDKRLADHPQDAKAYYDKGIALYLKSKSEGEINPLEVEQEIYQYNQAIDIEPDFYIAYINLARAYATIGEYAQAENTLLYIIPRAEKRGTNTANAYLNLALVRALAGKPVAAKDAFQEAISRAIYKAPVYFQYARFLEERQEDDAALNAYQNLVSEARIQDKGWAEGVFADFLRKIKLFDQAIDKYRQAISANTGDPLLPTYLAETYYEIGDESNALRWFDYAVEKNETKNEPYVFSSYCRVLNELRDYEKAADICQRAADSTLVDENK
jgi:tetratricopeptide (TPR) repeat protein